VANPFGLPGLSGSVAPAFYDIDGDGDQDLFVFTYDAGVRYFKNIGSADAPIFGLQVDNLGLPDGPLGGSVNHMTFLDADGDSNLDVFFGPWGEPYAKVQRYEWNG
jgi:hypothetical protein